MFSLLTSLMLLAAPPSGPTIVESTEYYEVAGSSAETASGCVRTAFEMKVTLVIALPKWKNRYDAAALADRWNIYLAALEAHERGHLEIALREAQDIYAQLSRITSAGTCAQLEESIDSTGKALIDDLNRVQVDYDRRTNHGATQGVRF